MASTNSIDLIKETTRAIARDFEKMGCAAFANAYYQRSLEPHVAGLMTKRH